MSSITINHNGLNLTWKIEGEEESEQVIGELWKVMTASGVGPPDSGEGSVTHRNRITPEFLSRVAEVFKAAPENGKTRAVANEFSVNPPSASNYINRARRAGLLPPSETHGRGGRKPRTKHLVIEGIEAPKVSVS